MTLILWCYKDVFKCSIIFEISLDPILTTDVLNTHRLTLHIRYNNAPTGSIGYLYIVLVGVGAPSDLIKPLCVIGKCLCQVGKIMFIVNFKELCFNIWIQTE